MPLEAVTGDHGDGVTHHLAHEAFGIGVHNHLAAFLAVFLKCLLRQPLSGGDPLQVVVGDLCALLPAGVEDGRFDVRHARCVGIHFTGDIQPAFLRAGNHLD